MAVRRRGAICWLWTAVATYDNSVRAVRRRKPGVNSGRHGPCPGRGGGIAPDLNVGTSVVALNGGWMASRADTTGVGALADLWRSLSRSECSR